MSRAAYLRRIILNHTPSFHAFNGASLRPLMMPYTINNVGWQNYGSIRDKFEKFQQCQRATTASNATAGLVIHHCNALVPNCGGEANVSSSSSSPLWGRCHLANDRLECQLCRRIEVGGAAVVAGGYGGNAGWFMIDNSLKRNPCTTNTMGGSRREHDEHSCASIRKTGGSWRWQVWQCNSCRNRLYYMK